MKYTGVMVVSCMLWLLHTGIFCQYRFTNYNFTHGLPITDISSFAEDSLGYLWMGSNSGLVRFDGLEFKYYEPLPDDSSSIKGSEIADIGVDAAGRVWITFHSGGLSIYDHNTGKFTSRSYTIEDEDDFPQGAIRGFYIDDLNHEIWAASSREGYYVIDMGSLMGKKVASFSRNYDVIADPTDNEYMILGGDKLRRINKTTGEVEVLSEDFYHELLLKGNTIIGHNWSSLVYTFNLNNREEQKFFTSDDYITRGLILNGEELWMANYGGIYSFSISGKPHYKVDLGSADANAIDSYHIFGIYKDNRERIWIGTDEGLSVIIPEYQVLKDVPITAGIRYSDIVPLEEEGKYLACSNYDRRIDVIDILNNTSKQVSYLGKKEIIGPNRLLKQKDKIWVLAHDLFGYVKDGDLEFRKFEGGRYNDFIHREGLGNILADQEGNIWLSKHLQNYFIKISVNLDSIELIEFPEIPNGEIKVTLLDGDYIWIGSTKGLCRFHTKTRERKWYPNSKPPYNVFTSNIEDMGLDSDNNLWVLGLDGGAWKCKYNNVSDTLEIIKGYFQTDGLANNRPWHIDMDENGILYFGSSSGLSIYDSSTDRMNSYGKEYGFAYLPLYTRIYDDKVFILSRGLSYFIIDNWDNSREIPEAKIRSIELHNSEVSREDNKFTHDQHDFNFTYSVNQLSRARDIRYKYRLNDTEPWIHTNYKNRRVTLNGLSPGTYTFEVSASNKDMIWGLTDTYSFTILPPYWQTWWFRALVLILGGGLIYTFIKWRERQIKKIAGLETRMTELENEALRAQMNPHFIFNSLNSIKSFIINNKKEEAADYLTTFAELIRTILRNSKSQLIPLSEEIKALDLYTEIENIRLNNKFDVEWDIDPAINLETYLVPPLVIQPFVENAIWHGFVHKNGRGLLTLKVDKNSKNFIIHIIDDGIGREKSKLIEAKHYRKRSYGIAITKQRLGMKESENIEIIDLKDENGNPSGTRVSVKIPINKLI